MRSGDNITVNPPLPLETLESYARDIFTPIKRGESVTSIWVRMAGRRIINKFIISYPELFKDSIDGSQLLVYIEPLELTEESNAGYIKLIAKSIVDSTKQRKEVKLGNEDIYYYSQDNYSEALARLDLLVQEISSFNITIVLFLGEFDEFSFATSVLYNNLKSLYTRARGSLQYVFLVLDDVTQPELLNRFGELNELLLRNVIYVPLCNDRETDYVIDQFSKDLNRQFSEEERQLLKELCGGHPFLLKSCTRLIALMNGQTASINAVRQMLFSHFEPRSVCQKIYGLLTDENKQLLRQIVSTKIKDLPTSAAYLIQLGLIKNMDDYWYPFGKLFEAVVENDGQYKTIPMDSSSDLTFEEKNGAIFIKGASVEDKFTRQEYEILRFLLSDPTKLRSRDEIGEAMWGKQSYEKYSDWAIDQVMSKIRKKLKVLGAGESLVTVRGRGYKLSLG